MSDVSLTYHILVFITKEFDFSYNEEIYKKESMLAEAGLVSAGGERPGGSDLLSHVYSCLHHHLSVSRLVGLKSTLLSIFALKRFELEVTHLSVRCLRVPYE